MTNFKNKYTPNETSSPKSIVKVEFIIHFASGPTLEEKKIPFEFLHFLIAFLFYLFLNRKGGNTKESVLCPSKI